MSMAWCAAALTSSSCDYRQLYRGTGGPTNPACMQRLLNAPNQAAVAQLVHLIDEHHQQPLADPIWDDLQDELW
jgi:hypothetical protein